MDYEKELELQIKELIVNNSYIEADDDDAVPFPDVENVQTFEENHLCTTDKGIVVDLNKGARIYLTIQVYR